MTFSSLATTVLWGLPLVLQCVIAFFMFLRGLTRKYPFFFSYTLFLPARDVVLWWLPYPGTRYSRIYWWGDAAAILLSLGVIVEILRHIVDPYPFLRIVFKVLWIVGFVGVIIGIAILLLAPGRSGSLIIESIILLERSARFLQVCLLTALVFLISRLGLTWHSYMVGIATGFGVYAALDLALLELRGNLHVITDSTFVLLGSASYNLAAVIWAVYFLRRRRFATIERLPATNVADWNEVLTERVDKWYQR
jgi:hypothetical protein